MKLRKAFKRRMNNLLRDVQSGAYEQRRHWVSIGYIKNRPRSFPPMTGAGIIGRFESVRFVTSEAV